jgi:hypothetical protein
LNQSPFHAENIHIPMTSKHHAIDMAILASCEHLIISTGTFGWWAAYLGPDSRSQGTVVYYDKRAVSDLSSAYVPDFYPTHWINVKSTKVEPISTKKPQETSTRNRISTKLSIGDSTVVTSYFPFITHNGDDCSIYMFNMLSLQDAMIIFTTSEYEDMVYSMRTHATNRTLVIVTKLQDTSVVKRYGMNFWEKQRNIQDDPRAWMDHRIYITDNEKMSFVHQSITLNPYGSTHFVWMDIGILRHTRYNGLSLVTDSLLFHTNMISVLDITALTHNYVLDLFKENENRIGSHVFGGTVDAMERFYVKYYETILLSSITGRFVGNDKFNMWRTCQRTKNMCSLVIPDSWFTSDDLLLYMIPFFLHKLSI